MPSRRAATVGALLVAVAVVAAFVASRSKSDPRESVLPHDAAPASSSRVASHRFVPGREVTYTTTYASDGALSAGASAGASHLVSKLSARLVRTTLGPASRGGLELLLYRFVDAKIEIAIDDSPRATDAARVEADLARGFVVQMAPSGTIASLRMDASAPSLSRAFARSLAAWTQVTLAANDASTWQAREVDTNGPYAAAYAVVPRPSTFADVLAIRKTKRQLGPREGERAATGIALLRAETGSTAVVEIDFDVARGELAEIAGDESTDATLGGLRLAHTKTTFDAERTADRTLDATALAALMIEVAPLLDAAPMALDAHDADASDSAKAEASRHWLAGATLPEIARGLDDEANAPREGRKFDLFLKLEAYAFLHPNECEAIARLMRTRPRGTAPETIVAALAATGSKEAQAALVDVVTARGASAEAQLRIVPSLGMLASPRQETEDAVRALRDTSPRADVAATAALALGIMARSIALTSPARATRIVDDALARLARDEGDESAQRFDLSVLGNTGSVRIVDDVVRLSRSSSPVLRAQAAFALRFVAAEAAESRLLEVLASDDDAQVRARAAAALAYREWTAASGRVQRARAVDEPDAAVRADLVRTLYAMRASDPDAMALVKERSERDPDPTVRAVASALIAAGDAPTAL